MKSDDRGLAPQLFKPDPSEDLTCRVLIDGHPVPMIVTSYSHIEGEAVLDFLDYAGSGWIRDEIEEAHADAETQRTLLAEFVSD